MLVPFLLRNQRVNFVENYYVLPKKNTEELFAVINVEIIPK